MSSTTRAFRTVWLGRRRYDPVHTLMQRLSAARIADELGDIILFLEHDPVITLGRGALLANVLVSEEARARAGVDLVETGRGGDVTYHGPGQLIAYPIIDLKPDRCDVRRYVHNLATVMVSTVGRYGVGAGFLPGKIGAWVDRESPAHWPGDERAENPAKIGAIGVRLSRWVTMHGFALNVGTDLGAFGMIVPCGIVEHGVTSLADLTGSAPPLKELAAASLPSFADEFAAEVLPLEDWSQRGLDEIS